MYYSDDEQKDSYEIPPPSKKQKLSENPIEVESVTSTPYLNTSVNKSLPFSIENILSPEFRARKNSNTQKEQRFSLMLSDDEDFDAFENNETSDIKITNASSLNDQNYDEIDDLENKSGTVDIKITNTSSLSFEQWMDW